MGFHETFDVERVNRAESDVCLPVGAWSTSPRWSNVFASGWGRLLHVSVLEPEQSNSDQVLVCGNMAADIDRADMVTFRTLAGKLYYGWVPA